jgi:hypothetical protein
MNERCDIYLISPLKGDSLLMRQMTVLQPTFSPESNREYKGFLDLDLPRLKAVAVVTQFRRSGVSAFNVPIRYRDSLRIAVEEAHLVASAAGQDTVISVSNQNPMFYIFRSSGQQQQVSEGGGLIIVDALDGHKWSADELAEYMYDFNNVI